VALYSINLIYYKMIKKLWLIPLVAITATTINDAQVKAGFIDDLKSFISGNKDGGVQNNKSKSGSSSTAEDRINLTRTGKDWTSLSTPYGVVEWKLPSLDQYPWDSRYFDNGSYLVRTKQNGSWQVIENLRAKCEDSPPSYSGLDGIGWQPLTSKPKFMVGYVAIEICRIRASVMGRDKGPQF